MYDLKCKREGCTFNKNCRCAAKHITVDNSAVCESYTPSPNYQKQEKSKIKQPAIRVSTTVDCHVTKCIFNQNERCIANGISVATLQPSNQPECLTIKEK